jgi:hypothetical protein
MPPKKEPSASASPATRARAGAKIAPVSDDPKIQARRDAQRASYAKKKSVSTATSTANSLAPSTATSRAGSSSPPGAKKRGRPPKAGTATASGATTVANPTFVMTTGGNASLQKLNEEVASSTIGRAIKNKLARTKLAELKYDREIDKYVKRFNTRINIPYKDAIKYFSKDKRMMRYLEDKYNYDNLNDDSVVDFIYKPYSTYDLFEFSYRKKGSKYSSNYRTKVPRSRDVDYSDYLYNKYITKGVQDYDASSGSGSIRGEGSSGAVSSNMFPVGTKSDAISPFSASSSGSLLKGLPTPTWSVSSSSSPVIRFRNARSVSSSVKSSSSSNGSDDRRKYRNTNSLTNSD